jgi:hypothetical protein
MHSFFKKKLIYYIDIFFILSIWFCIDTNFDNIFPLFSNHNPWKHDIAIKYFFLFLRSSGPFIFFFILFFLSFFYKNKIQFLTKNKTLNFILIILYLNFIFQFIGLFFSENNINNSYYSFLSILSIIAMVNLYNAGLHNINYLISLCVLTPVVIVYGYFAYEWFLTTRNLNMYGTFPDVFLPLADFSSNVIRSSGLSRSSTILLIPLFYLILIDKIKFFYLIPYSRLVYLIPYLILSGIIFYCQSRIVILFFLSFSIFSIFYFLWNKTKKYKFKKAFILVILPTIFVISLLAIKEEVHTKNFTNKAIKFFFNKEAYFSNNKPPAGPLIRKFESTSISSHRFDYWKVTIEKSKKPIIGYGPLGDRFLLADNTQSAHNTLIYSYASGGIISSILILILIFRYTYLCLFLTFVKKIRLVKKNVFVFSSIFTISFLFIRGITENSVAVFSIDLLIFLSCITICEKFKNQKLQ